MKWKARIQSSKLELEEDGRYVDDARAFMYPVRPGWRWDNGELWYSREWEAEDAFLSPVERTKRVVEKSMEGVVACLKFTTETGEDFEDGWLPTLDFKIRIRADNIIEYSFFEKPTAANRCLQEDTALNHNSLIMSLSNEVGRRLDNCSPTIPTTEKVEILDKFSQKLVNSGHTMKTVRTILVGGIKGYLRKVARSLEKGEPLHRSSKQSSKARRTKKLLARTDWFRKEKEEGSTQEPVQAPMVRGGAKKSRVAEGKSSKEPLRTTSVLFVEFSRGGSLQKDVKECLDKLSPMLGFKVRVAEKGGTQLSSLLSNKNLWSGVECGRDSCRTCQQPGDTKEPCMLRNVLYESECSKCNPPGSRKEADKHGLDEKREDPSLYVGETARSVAERASEHWRDAETGKEESHMLEHQAAGH